MPATGHCTGHRSYTKGCTACQQVTRAYQARHPRASRATGLSTVPAERMPWDQRPGRDAWNRMNAIGRRLGVA